MRLAALALVVLTACGRFGSGDDQASSEAGEKFSYGSDSSALSTTAPPPEQDGQQQGPTGSVAPAATEETRDVRRGQNWISRLDESGFDMMLVVDRDTSGDGLLLQLHAKNAASGTLYYDGSLRPTFEIVPATGAAEPRWTSESCRAKSAPKNPTMPPQPLAPGESTSYMTRYPAPDGPGYDTERTECRLPPGEYRARGFLYWCKEVVTTGNGGSYCDPDHVARLAIEFPIQLG